MVVGHGGAPPRQCGTCSLCCKLPYVAELNKPIDTWCRHCKPGRNGCGIYPDRPGTCKSFACHWLKDLVDDVWFPAQCKMVLTQLRENHLLVTVDPGFPNAWRREPYYASLRNYAVRGVFVEVRIGRRTVRLLPDGSEQEVYRSQAHIEGRPEDG
jgi:hypothetical protein